jgi:hypothetical protein
MSALRSRFKMSYFGQNTVLGTKQCLDNMAWLYGASIPSLQPAKFKVTNALGRCGNLVESEPFAFKC